MKQKIKEALQQEYKNLGLNDEAFERVAKYTKKFEKTCRKQKKVVDKRKCV